VTDVPTGNETGTFLAMDLGGTNIRACSVDLQGHGKFVIQSSKAMVPEALQKGTCTALFGYLADHLRQFLQKQHLRFRKVPGMTMDDYYRLGFTFSFPVIQTSINTGKLLRWTKGYNIQVFLHSVWC
jgi:hexokinase